MAGSGVVGGELTEQARQSQAQAEASMDAALDTLDGVPQSQAKERDRDPSTGRFAEAGGRAPKDTKDEPSPPAASEKRADTADYDKAVRAIRMDGYPDSMIEKLSREQVIEIGLKRASNHADVDRAKNRVSELERQVQSHAEAQQSDDDPAKLDGFDDVVEQFGEYFGEDAEPMVRSLIERVTKSAPKGSPDKAVEALQGQVLSLQQQLARSSLEREFPHLDLDDSERWQRVVDARKGDSRKHQDEAHALRAAVHDAFAAEVHATLREQTLGDAAARDNGTLDAGGPMREAPTEPTKDDLEDDLLNALQDGDDDRAQKIARKLGRGTTDPFSAMSGLTERRVG